MNTHVLLLLEKVIHRNDMRAAGNGIRLITFSKGTKLTLKSGFKIWSFMMVVIVVVLVVGP